MRLFASATLTLGYSLRNSTLISQQVTESETPTLRIDAVVASCVNYASWQNSVPLLNSLDVENNTPHAFNNLRLEVRSSPAIIRPTHWILDSLAKESRLSVRDHELHLDPDYLNGLNEAERCRLTFTLHHEGAIIAECEHDLRVLARDEWGGMSSGGELLAAFVMPNDPAVASILKLAGAILVRHGHSSGLDGYQSGDPRRVYMLTAALWSAIAEKSLTYANPPSSFEETGQKTRKPSLILQSGLATCLDSTLLFAAAIEAIGLNAVIIMLREHCCVGVWLVEKTFKQLIEPDCSEVRKALTARELVTFETTLVSRQPPAKFESAITTAEGLTSEIKEGNFVAAIDVARARMAQIRPLASHRPTSSEPGVSVEADSLPLPSLPAFDGLSVEVIDVTPQPTTAAGRIERWQRKLLNLSLNNRLLNFKATKQTVPLLCPRISNLEDRLADGARLRLISLVQHNPRGDRDAELHQKKTGHDLDAEFARLALERDEVACPLPEPELTNRLTTLYRTVRNDLAEGGSNTLYLAVGFLRWKPHKGDPRICKAPLILIPAKLLRKSAVSPYHLVKHEDEPRFNATLIQMLKKDFGRDLTFFETALPTDDSGIDVPSVLERMRREVRDIPGFEVTDETALGTFSFVKYLMWKDLVDRLDSLERNRVVRHLTHDPDKPFESVGGSIPHPAEIDTRYEPGNLVHPLPADSSQLAAVMTAAEGKDFVLVGPPGTGKSQTIANIIAQCLSMGKTVLFVAEKTAALDVVYRRLREHGLGDCCLELHSSKAERRRFLEQLEASWERNRKGAENEWLTISERLKVRRDELNSYVTAIHKTHPNGWTAYGAMAHCVKGRQVTSPEFQWANTAQHDKAAYENLEHLVSDLSRTYQEVDWSAPLWAISAETWSARWEADLLAECSRVSDAATLLKTAIAQFATQLELTGISDVSATELSRFLRLATALTSVATEDVRMLFHEQFASFATASTQLQLLLQEYHQAHSSITSVYDEQLHLIPIDDIDRQWREANARFWPLSWFGRRKVVKLLQSYASSGTAIPQTDIEVIRKLKSQLDEIRRSPLAEHSRYWNAQHTNIEQLKTQIAKADELRLSIISVGKPRNTTTQISETLRPILSGDQATSPVFVTAQKFIEAVTSFQTASQAFRSALGTPTFCGDAEHVVATVLEAAAQIKEHRRVLQRWTSWCEVRARAETAGFKDWVQALQNGSLDSQDLVDRFRLGYARWWIPGVIDSDLVLQKFQRFKHEDAITDFRALDDQARAAASIHARQAAAHELPSPDSVARKSELGLLRHQLGLKRPSKSIREVISSMPESFGKLAPCLLMSPLSIAQYLPAEQPPFDVVIFDEASQITTWDAIGAIARGEQTIIVGDPKQLPPTNFFGRSDDDEANDEIEDHEKDLESILDEAKAAGLPTLQLNWHYRSRHESLIAFSNWNYYGNQLVSFPAAESADRGVSFRHLPDAVYDRGNSRTNRAEAMAIVEDAVARMKSQLASPENKRRTFGVITFNSQQQSLIQDLLDQAQRDNPELDWYFSDDRIEPTVVKNLENVQGDERDVMFFSITFGRDISGKPIPLTFGALNRDGGERRLNVAVTRARQQLVVYSSFKADQLAAEQSQARGVRDLKAFLEYAEKGPEAIASRTSGSLGSYESPLEAAIAESLHAKGWQITPQVGVSGFRVDLGVVHPDKPGAYLAGIECDGATYHRSPSARDRDKTRQQVLENLGWKILRVWSRDWWYDAETALNRLHQDLTMRLEESRKSARSEV